MDHGSGNRHVSQVHPKFKHYLNLPKQASARVLAIVLLYSFVSMYLFIFIVGDK